MLIGQFETNQDMSKNELLPVEQRFMQLIYNTACPLCLFDNWTSCSLDLTTKSKNQNKQMTGEFFKNFDPNSG